MSSDHGATPTDLGTDLLAAPPRYRAVLAYLDRRAVGRANCHTCGAEIAPGEQATIRAACSTGTTWRKRLYCKACDYRELRAPTRGRWEFIVRGCVASRDGAASTQADAILTDLTVLDCSFPGEGENRSESEVK